MAPQSKAERRYKTLNIRDIRCFVCLWGCANHSFSTNPSGEQSRTGWVGWCNPRGYCIYCTDIMQLAYFSFSSLCKEIINKNIDKAGVFQNIYRLAWLKRWWSNRWSKHHHWTISTSNHQLSQAGLTIGNERIVRWCNITDLQSIRNESRFWIGSLFFPKLADCLPTFVSFLSLVVLSLYRKLNAW